MDEFRRACSLTLIVTGPTEGIKYNSTRVRTITSYNNHASDRSGTEQVVTIPIAIQEWQIAMGRLDVVLQLAFVVVCGRDNLRRGHRDTVLAACPSHLGHGDGRRKAGRSNTCSFVEICGPIRSRA